MAHVGEVAKVFLKLGTIGFGGPAAHVALLEDEVVTRRRWVTHDRFLDLLGATNLIPGPNSTEMAIHLGYHRAGWPGLIVGGTCFTLPAALIVGTLAWVYVTFGSLPQLGHLLGGVKPVVIAIIVQAMWRLGRSTIRTIPRAMMAVAAAGLNLAGANELAVLFGIGFISLAVHAARTRRSARASPTLRCQTAGLLPLAALSAGGTATAAAAAAAPVAIWPLFAFFLKVGSILFGTGYVLLAFLRADLVERWGWLTETQLLDAIAVGQVTPGPLFTTATFIGYLLAGPVGAVVATAGIFLPAFVYVAISGPLIPKMRQSALAGAFLDGLTMASLGLLVAVMWYLARGTLVDMTSILIAAVALALLLRFKLNSAWLVLGGAAAGLLLGQ